MELEKQQLLTLYCLKYYYAKNLSMLMRLQKGYHRSIRKVWL